MLPCELALPQNTLFDEFDANAQESIAKSSGANENVLAEALRKKGSVVFRDTPLAEVILILSEQWDVNIVAGAEIDGDVSGTFKNESLEEILDSLLTASGFNYRQIGKSLVVLSAGNMQTGRPSFEVAVIDIPTSSDDDLDELIEVLRLIMSPEGQIQPIRASGKIAIHDTPKRIEQVKSLLKDIVSNTSDEKYVATQTRDSGAGPQRPAETIVAAPLDGFSTTGVLELRPQYVLATDLRQPFEMVFDGGSGEGQQSQMISIIEQENMLVVMGDAATHQKARALLQQLDKPRPQVRITGYIYDVDLGEAERFGIDWNQQFMTSAVDANGIPRNLGLAQGGLLTPNPPNNAAQIVTGLVEDAAGAAGAAAGAGAATTAGTPNGGQFLFRTLNSQFELQALIQALDQTKGSRLLADPHVTVVDRHTASLGIVTKIPVQQLTQTQQGGSIGTTSFQEAGILLDVTPRIASDGTIEMEVSPEFSVLTGFQGGNPIIDTRRASTVVRVSHGQSLVIGGLRSKTTVETVKGIPGLMNVKWLGALFRMHDTDVRESEMIVMIMPEIIGYCGGLPREMHALDVTRTQLSRIQTAVDGSFTPDCKDKHCPNHYERPRIHNGMHDIGLIGTHDAVFVNPLPPVIYSPANTTPLIPTAEKIIPVPAMPDPDAVTRAAQRELDPVHKQNPASSKVSLTSAIESMSPQTLPSSHRSSRRIPARPISAIRR